MTTYSKYQLDKKNDILHTTPMYNTVEYFPEEEEEARKWEKQGYTLLPLDKKNDILLSPQIIINDIKMNFEEKY